MVTFRIEIINSKLVLLQWSTRFHLEEYFSFANRYLNSIISVKYRIYLKDIIALPLVYFLRNIFTKEVGYESIESYRNLFGLSPGLF